MKGEGKSRELSVYELGSLYQDYTESVEGIKNKCEHCIHLLKDRYQPERRKVTQQQTCEVDELYKECGTLFKILSTGSARVQAQLKDRGKFLRYRKLSEQFFIARGKIKEKIKMTDSLIAQGAISSRIKASLPKVREFKNEMDKTLSKQRSLIKQEFGNRNFFIDESHSS